MNTRELTIKAEFSKFHHIDQNYHSNHSQLLHRHDDQLELLYVVNGTGQYIVDQKSWNVQSGNLIICNPGILHGEVPFSANCMESYCCVLKNIWIENLPAEEFLTLSQNPVLNFTEDRQGFEHLLCALKFFSACDPPSLPACDLLGQSVLSIVCQKLRKRHQPDTVLRKKVDYFIDSVISYLNDHYRESITLKELGERFHISHYYLSHIFKEQTGYSPMKYVAQLRIGEAQSLLMNTEKSITAISEELGFHDNSHFNVSFKKYTNLSPSEYRQYLKDCLNK